MQFRLLTVLILMAAVSVGCALLFAAPAWISIPALTLILWVSPAFWIAGVVYARGGRQAFFLGGLVAGAIPFLITSVYSMNFASRFVRLLTTGNATAGSLYRDDFDIANVTFMGLALLSPGLFSVIGGGLAVLVRWINLPCMTRSPGDQHVPPSRQHALDEDPNEVRIRLGIAEWEDRS